MNVVLIATYEMGRQPFGLASPAAWLRAEGADVRCLDLFVERLDDAQIASAELVAFYLPMHTATRIAASVIPRLRRLNPQAHIACYGLYAPLNAAYLRSLGAQSILGGEFEQPLLDLLRQLKQAHAGQPHSPTPSISLARQRFRVPDRSGLPALERYARLCHDGQPPRVAGYTEASRGCKHLCRHCPVVPVYGGRFRIVDVDVVLDDITRQVEVGAQHITFGDPDFFNGPTHALRVVKALHARFPQLSYDVTIKVEHLLKHARYLPALRESGCALVTSAVESLDDRILARLEKGHTRAGFIRAVELTRAAGLPLQPTFVTFTPWTTLDGYLDLLATLDELGLAASVPPIQLAIRLLIPAGSRLLELAEVEALVAPFDASALSYPWRHPDPRVDALHAQVLALVKAASEQGQPRSTIFARVWELAALAAEAAGSARTGPRPGQQMLAARPIPWLSEPWYC